MATRKRIANNFAFIFKFPHRLLPILQMQIECLAIWFLAKVKHKHIEIQIDEKRQQQCAQPEQCDTIDRKKGQHDERNKPFNLTLNRMKNSLIFRSSVNNCRQLWPSLDLNIIKGDLCWFEYERPIHKHNNLCPLHDMYRVCSILSHI